MTYVRKFQPVPMQSLGGVVPSQIIDALRHEFGVPSEEMACLNTANASAKVQQIDGRIEDLAVNWQPTGFYKPDQLKTIYNEVTLRIAEANSALNTAMLTSTSDAVRQVNQARAYLNRATERGTVYARALTQAAATGVQVLDSPGLKNWVLQSLVNVSQAYTTVGVLACQSSWLDYVAAAITKAWQVIKAIVGVAVKIGETVLKVADDLPQIWTVLKWGALAAAGVFGVIKLKKYRDTGSW